MMQKKFWYEYELNDGEVAKSMHEIVKTLNNQQSEIQLNNLRNMRFYSNTGLEGLSVSKYMTNTMESGKDHEKISLNVVKACSDTLIAKIGKNKIRPKFLTDGGSWKKQREAMKLEKFVAGVYYQAKVPRLAPRVLKDTCIIGTGAAHVYKDENKKIAIERVFADELVVDPNEAYYGSPRTLYRQKFVSRQTLIDRAEDEETKKLIRQTPIVSQTSVSFSDSVLAIEAWRLPSRKGAKDGRHTLTLQNVVLFDEEYKRDHFPFAFMRYTEMPLGFFGVGIAEELRGIQVEINRLLNHIKNSFKLVSRPWVLCEKTAQINAAQLTNKIGGKVEYVATPPIFITPQTVGQEVFNQLENLYRKAYEIVGISQLSASSKNPLGANASGRALREFNDIETERFSQTGFMYEQFHVELAELIIELAKEMHADGIDFKTKAFSRLDGVEEIAWSEIDLDSDDCILQIFPASALPKEPWARLETVNEMIQGGFTDRETGIDLLDFPDLDKQNMLQNAPVRLIKRSIEKMLDEGEFIQPDPFWGLEQCVLIGQRYYNYCQLMNIEPDRMELLVQFMNEAKGLLIPPAPAAPEAMPIEAPLDPMAGMPMPVDPSMAALPADMPLPPQAI